MCTADDAFRMMVGTVWDPLFEEEYVVINALVMFATVIASGWASPRPSWAILN